jgi:DNA-directed RNA polymerase subunit K/omega
MASKKVKINPIIKKDDEVIVDKKVDLKEKEKLKVKSTKVEEINKTVESDEEEESNKKIKTDFDAYEFYKTYDPSKNVFNNVLSLYEFTSCLGLRATQISEGCPVLIDVPEGIESPEEIAIMEMKAGKCPLIICREGREYWRVCDLINPHLE